MSFQSYLDEEVLTFDKDIDQELHQLLRQRQVRVAVVESMSGGLLAHRLMHRPGSSEFFVGGITCYDAVTKINLCGVRAKTIREFGPVSKEVVEEMMEGARRLLNADVICALTGIAGPSDEEFSQNQVGKLCFGLWVEGRTMLKTAHITGNRGRIISQGVSMVVGMLRQYLKADLQTDA